MTLVTKNAILLAALCLAACSSSSTMPASTAMSTPPMSSWTAPPDANSVVTLVEIIPRQQVEVGTGTVAGAAVGGTAGLGMSDRVYRITVRMDDGSIKTVTQESAPGFLAGDRVKTLDTMIQR